MVCAAEEAYVVCSGGDDGVPLEDTLPTDFNLADAEGTGR